MNKERVPDLVVNSEPLRPGIDIALEHVDMIPITGGGAFRRIVECLPAAVYATDANGVVTFYNQAAVELAGRQPRLGKDRWCVSWRLYQADGTRLAHEDCPMAVTIKTGRPVRGVELIAERPDGRRIPVLPHPTPLTNAAGRLIGAVNMLVDISERRMAEIRQRAAMQELNHRVKNNMQLLDALLATARRDTVSVEARQALSQASQRVAAMAAAQKVLYEADNVTRFRTPEFLEAMCENAERAFHRRVEIVAEEPIELSNDIVMPLALILNELLSKAADGDEAEACGGAVRVGLKKVPGSLMLFVEDRHPGSAWGRTGKSSSGLGLVAGLARQLGGSLQVTRKNGARCVVQFIDRGHA